MTSVSLTPLDARPATPAASRCGLTRIDFVRVLVGVGGLRYEAVGEGHRHRSECPVSASVALGLIGTVPFVVRRPASGKAAR